MGLRGGRWKGTSGEASKEARREVGRSFEAGMGAGARSQRDSPSQGRGIGGPAKCVELGGREQGDREVGSAGCSDRCSPPHRTSSLTAPHPPRPGSFLGLAEKLVLIHPCGPRAPSRECGWMLVKGQQEGLLIVFMQPRARCWVGPVREDRALIVLWVSMWDQPPDDPTATRGWLPANATPIPNTPRTQDHKREQTQCFSSFTNDTFPFPASRGLDGGGVAESDSPL